MEAVRPEGQCSGRGRKGSGWDQGGSGRREGSGWILDIFGGWS